MNALNVWHGDLQAHATEPPWSEPPQVETQGEETEPELCLYRSRTVNVLKKYLRLSIQTGRLPSLLGNLHFRARNSSYQLHTFEDAVIFVLDVKRSLQELDRFSREVIGRVILQEHTAEHAARKMHCSNRSIERRLQEALDQLTKHMLERGILSRSEISPKSCQEGKSGQFPLSPWKEGE